MEVALVTIGVQLRARDIHAALCRVAMAERGADRRTRDRPSLGMRGGIGRQRNQLDAWRLNSSG